MKKATTILFLFFLFTTYSQDISGSWMGEIDLMGEKLGFGFKLTKVADQYTATLNVPLKGIKDAASDKTLFENQKLSMSFAQHKVKFEGTLTDNQQIKGNLILGGNSFPLVLKQGLLKLNRPQEPLPPFAYYSVEVTIKTADNYQLEGTLSLPSKNGKFPIAIIISGSGPQNRDGEMFGHKPYLVLADHLTKNGIGVLRFDERGVGKSTGNFKEATLATFISDVESAIQYLKTRKDLNITKLGLIGHSIGGIVAPRVAENNNNVDFIVLLAGPGINGDQLMLLQKASLERGIGISEQQIVQGQDVVKGAYEIIVTSGLNNVELKDRINAFFVAKYGAMLPESQREKMVEQITGNEMVDLIRAKPSEVLEKIKCPLLALNGDKDFQVPAKENLEAIGAAAKKGGNKKVKIIELKNLNHLFQESTTGLLQEYGKIEQTFSPVALNAVSDWIKEQLR